VDAAYAAPGGAVEAWAAVLGFSGQIYCDFSGYSLCAIGLALCFGFEFPDNFRYPYAARGFSDFWRRWHITLSSWLRDYLYVPLGGNRHGRARTYLNLLLTMLIGGLWHGASWMFVLWGGLHGAYLAIERWLRERSGGAPTERRAAAGLTLCTFLLVTLTWIPFRARDTATAVQVFTALFRFLVAPTLGTVPLLWCYAAAASLLLWQLLNRDISLEQRFQRFGPAVQTLILGGALVGIFLCSGGDERAFIYFQF
ncbi:MAG TPA: MBOAT family O-acyltransferase, partial [Gammaproteobacteria bacterium]|nr:MBOAT family O-acyltransferase [Gammaproteobacteria bacterium]